MSLHCSLCVDEDVTMLVAAMKDTCVSQLLAISTGEDGHTTRRELSRQMLVTPFRAPNGGQ